MLVSKLYYNDIIKLLDKVKTKISGSQNLESAAQNLVEAIYNELSDSIILLRLFVTIKQKELPDAIQTFTRNLARSANIKMTEDAYVLTLFGTAGKKAEWQTRSRSKGHLGIPLATEDFVSAIPMMSALLEQLGFNLGWIRGEPEIVAQKMGQMAGTFYVKDADTSKDSKGRKIISAFDFVKEFNVKTVFGIGGGYTLTDKFFTMICFLNEFIDRDKAIWFQSFSNLFKSETAKFVKNPNQFFK
ncbi:hypothetical protein JXQ70_11040 [bacterium]|nr:hypothetical protein [bacterium]